MSLRAARAVIASLALLLAAHPGTGFAATAALTGTYMAASSGPGGSMTTQFPPGVSPVYFDYSVVTPSTTDTAEVVVFANGTSGQAVADASVYLGNGTSLSISLTPFTGSWATGGYCTVLYVDSQPVTVNGQMPLAWAVGTATPPSCINPPDAWFNYSVPITTGWNLVNVPVRNSGITSTSTLVRSLDSQLGANAIPIVSTYGNGTYHVYVPGYASDQSLAGNQGIFVLSTVGGSATWNVQGDQYAPGIPIAIAPGWNLVAAPYPPQGLPADVIASEINQNESSGGTVTAVAQYTSTGYVTYVPGTTGGPDPTISPTGGMWVESTGTSNWAPS